MIIATRNSPMALWQAKHIQSLLQQRHPDLKIELLPIVTQGDSEQNKSLLEIGGKTVFVKELQKALLENQADIAVHCIKDLSARDCPGLMLAATCKRDDPRDVLVSSTYKTLDALPPIAIVGTGSPRRQSLLKKMYRHIQTKLLRGNVNTRLKKLDAGEYDAIILAAAGLNRLGLQSRIADYLDPKQFIPAIAQGCLGIECRENDAHTQQLVAFLNDKDSELVIRAERTVNRYLGGDCHTPLGVHATLQHGQLHIDAMVGSVDGNLTIESHVQGNANDLMVLAKRVADDLLTKGAKELLS